MANTIIDFASFVLVALLYINGRHQPSRDYRQIVFNKMQCCMLCYILSDFAAWCIDGKLFSGSNFLQLLLNTAVFFTQVLYIYFWMNYSDYWLFHSIEHLKRRKILYRIPLAVESGLLIANLFSGVVFQIDEMGTYIRGALYLTSILPFYVYDLASFCIIFKEFFAAKDKERKIDCLWLVSFCAMPIIASFILLVYGSGVSVIAPFYALSLLAIYLFVHQRRLAEERENFARREAQLRQENFALMLSQIQPHFLYNSLTVIASLCHGKAPEAEETTVEFSEYLRCNLDSIKADKPIPFTEELRHTKIYLALEQRRFEERLTVRWDIQDELFRLPALTLQPMVENAVRYGITKKERGGTLWISSHETADRHEITVRDDGLGFDTNAAPNDGRSHIGIATVRERLRAMCGGKLEIHSTPGEGTTVIISIPKEETADENSSSGR